MRSAREVIAIARSVPKVRRVLARNRGWTRTAFLKAPLRWQVSYFAHVPRGKPAKEIAQVLIDDRSGRVLEAWTGFQVAWTMARGYKGAFGRKADALYVWIPLCLLFVIPFLDPRRLWRLLHLDVLVLLAFSVSLAFFNHGRIGLSVPLVYPLLGYLLVRMLLAARSEDRAAPLRLLVPVSWLSIGIVFLVGFRVGLNVASSNVIDVGSAGVIGADLLTTGKPLYGHFPKDNEHGDTYGPVNYDAYVPFEQALPYKPRAADPPAAHGAAIAFDLLTVLGLWLLGRRIRGPTLGVLLAYAWVAFPFTLFVSNSNSNDELVALFVVAALLFATSPLARGSLVALGGLTKFAPLALAPLFATYPAGTPPIGPVDERRTLPRAAILFGAAFGVTALLVLAPVLSGTGLHVFFDRTLRFQSDRGSPFSVWGLYGGLGTLQAAVKVAAAGLALAVAFVPRRRDIVTLSALGAAVIIALQLGVTHWFYLYIVWFLPLVLVALLARYAEPRVLRI